MNFELLLPAVVLASLTALHILAKDSAIVAGKIFDGNKQPAEGTQIRIGGVMTYTDSLGQFQFMDVPFGDHVMSMRRGSVVKKRRIQIRRRSLVLYETIG